MTKAQKTIQKKAKAKAKEIMADKSIKKKDRVRLAEEVKAEATTQIETIDKARNAVSGTLPTCYVCLRRIKLNKVYIGNGKYRHAGCYAGSPRWMESDIGKLSSYRKYFEVKGEI
jgi:hypothetical protein